MTSHGYFKKPDISKTKTVEIINNCATYRVIANIYFEKFGLMLVKIILG